jgi:membrane-associated phospholipid phosphatase
MSALSPRQHSLNRQIWYAIIAVIAIDAIWALAAGLSFDVSQATIFFYVFAGCAALSLVYRYIRRDDQIYLLGHVTNQLICASAALGMLSYLTARANLPLIDGALIALDRLLFFDWLHYVERVNAHPQLARIFTLAYCSSGPQILVFAALLFLFRQSAQLQRFIVAFFATGLITVLLAMLFPAVGGYVYYNIDLAQYANLQPAAARIHEQPLLGMRDGSILALAFPLQGLITFPSFHSALSLLLIYASWPVRWLRWISLPLNLLVLASTPVDGGHYLVDIIGGIAVALAGMALADKLFPRGQ